MSIMDVVQRLAGLPPKRQLLVARTVVDLTVASVAISLLPFSRAIRIGCVPLGVSKKSLPLPDYVWAIEAVSRRLPWRTVCFQKGVAVQALLRRSGVDARLHYGARRNADSGELEAHVWVTAGTQSVIGVEEAKGFAELATYPREDQT